MTVRQHWAALVSPAVPVLIVIALLSWWALAHPSAIVGALHLNTASPELPFVKAFYRGGNALLFLILGGAALVTFIRFGSWSITSYEIEAGTLTNRFGPFRQERMPLHAIQDVQVSRSAMGLALGYGTIAIEAGFGDQILTFVPDPQSFVAEIRPS